MEHVRTGARLTCAGCGTQVMVVKAPSAVPSCCGVPLTGPAAETTAPTTGKPAAMANDLGKRCACDECGAIFLVIKAGAGTIECHGRPAPQQATKQLPSSD